MTMLLLLLLSCEPPPPFAVDRDLSAARLYVDGLGTVTRFTDPQTHAICYWMAGSLSCVCPDDGCRAVE